MISYEVDCSLLSVTHESGVFLAVRQAKSSCRGDEPIVGTRHFNSVNQVGHKVKLCGQLLGLLPGSSLEILINVI